MLDDVEARLASFRFQLALIHSFFAIRLHAGQFQGLLEELQPQDLPAADVIKGVREELHAVLASLNDLTKAQALMQEPAKIPVQGDPLDSIPESECAEVT